MNKNNKKTTLWKLYTSFLEHLRRKDLFSRDAVKKEMLIGSTLLILAVFFALGVSFYSTQLFFKALEEKTVIMKLPYDVELFQDIKELTQDHPLESMSRYIAEYDLMTAAYVVAIAKKESNWGKISPLDSDGTHCYNYWGFRLQSYERVTPSGYSCFSSPKEAVDVIAHRIYEMIYTQDRAEPEKMVAWKCGYDCSTHSTQSVNKWISDVDFYVKKVLENESP